MFESFAAWLQAQLARNRMRPGDLSERLGVHPSTVARWISGETRPRMELLSGLAEVFNEDVGLVLSLAGYRLVMSTQALTPDEAELLMYFRRLSPEQRRIIVAGARGGQPV